MTVVLSPPSPAATTTFHETGLEAVVARAMAGGELAVADGEGARANACSRRGRHTASRRMMVWLEDLKAALESVAGGMPDRALGVCEMSSRAGRRGANIAKPILAANGKPPTGDGPETPRRREGPA